MHTLVHESNRVRVDLADSWRAVAEGQKEKARTLREYRKNRKFVRETLKALHGECERILGQLGTGS